MKGNLKRGFLLKTLTLISILTLIFSLSITSDAKTNQFGETLGFTIDEENYEVNNWVTDQCQDVLYNNQRIGFTQIYYTIAKAKEKVGNRYLLIYYFAVKTCPLKATYGEQFLWWVNYHDEYGYNTKCELLVYIPKSFELVDATPKCTTSSNSYSVGGSLDSSGIGISGSVNFESEALSITNNSSAVDHWVDVRINLNEENWRWEYARTKYARQNNIQLFSYSVLVNEKDLYDHSTMVNVKTEYGTCSDYEPNLWTNLNYHYGSNTKTFWIGL